MSYSSFFTPLISAFLTVTILTVSVFALWPPKKAEAVFGAGDTTFEIGNIPEMIYKLLVSIAETAFATLKKSAVKWLTTKIQNAIMGIKDDSTAKGFIQDWSKTFFDAADGLISNALNDLFSTNLCKLPSHFNADILKKSINVNLGLVPSKDASKAAVNQIKTSACRVTQIASNVSGLWDSAKNVGKQLGHDSWKNWAINVQPNGNEFGVYINTVTALQTNKATVVKETQTKAIAYKGYNGNIDPDTGKVLVPGSTAGSVQAQTYNTPVDSIIAAKDVKQLGAAIFSAFLIRGLNEGLSAVGSNVKLPANQLTGTLKNAADGATSPTSNPNAVGAEDQS